jgi:uncharacterized zinc-type alcohol dehydrogenase-like protein
LWKASCESTVFPNPPLAAGGTLCQAAAAMTRAYSTASAAAPLAPATICRRDPGPTDIRMEILFCGVCHTDLHISRNDWGGTTYPCVPGHEIVGRVSAVGAKVTKFKEGDLAAVGCMVDSCGACENCRDGLEQYCEQSPVFTYNSPDRHLGGVTYGGYSERLVVDESFALRVPESLDPAATAPLLCAPGSRPTRRCATIRWGRGRPWASWDWAGSGTWA